MTPEQAAAYITIIGLLGTAVNIWLTLSIQKSVLSMKLWVRENFVAKEDLPQYLQFAESKARIMRTANEQH